MAEPATMNLRKGLPGLSKAWGASVMALAILSGMVLCTPTQEPIVHAAGDAKMAAGAPAYTADGKMLFPYKYREWIYVTTGMDMSYTQASNMAGSAGMSMFDNVFVNPEAYRSYVKTGTWPDKTVMLIEVRGAQSRGSINKSGHFQGADLMGLEVHVKDESRTPGSWAFYEFDGESPSTIVPRTATCYSCHEQHGAVDTTFVQFYPTLLPVAKAKGTLSAAYVKDEGEKKP
ncbi:MAG TPA: cytochrome P460 family protein [Acidisarcina sp.]